MTSAKIAALLDDAGIVRNRLKIASAVANAQAFLAVQKEFGSFDAYIWQFVDGRPLQNRWRSMDEVPAKTAQSDAMSKDLAKRGFRFVGSTICYAFMQATGMVNDHLAGCFRYGSCDEALHARRGGAALDARAEERAARRGLPQSDPPDSRTARSRPTARWPPPPDIRSTTATSPRCCAADTAICRGSA